MFNIKDKFVRKEMVDLQAEFYEYRRTVNGTNVSILFPLNKRVADLDANMGKFILAMNEDRSKLEKRIIEYEHIIKLLLDQLNLEVKYTPPDEQEHYEIVSKEDESDK